MSARISKYRHTFYSSKIKHAEDWIIDSSNFQRTTSHSANHFLIRRIIPMHWMKWPILWYPFVIPADFNKHL